MEPKKTKVCKQCCKRKSLTEFYKHPTSKGGFAARCKQCLSTKGKFKGICEICRKPETTKDKTGRIKEIALDHDHKTGKDRGYLCQRCNSMLGFAVDNVTTLAAGIIYLNKYSKKVAYRQPSRGGRGNY